jgi:GT2 family glycosyltransferase
MMGFLSKFEIFRQAVNHESGPIRLLLKLCRVVYKEGIPGVLRRITHLKIVSLTPPSDSLLDYQDWMEVEPVLTRQQAKALCDELEYQPLVSVICPVFNPNQSHLKEALQSVLGQSYSNWQLCICDDGSQNFDTEAFVSKFKEPRFTYSYRAKNGNISLATNTAVETAKGEYLVFLDQDDTLSNDALLWLMTHLNLNPDAKFIYSDEDKLDKDGERCDPHFKPDWNYHYFLACNYTCHASMFETNLIKQLGGCREGVEGAQDYDLTLRAIEQIEPQQIIHIPRILYHWRKHPDSTSENAMAKPQAISRGEIAVRAHLERSNINAIVQTIGIRYKVEYSLESHPSVMIVIPTRDGLELLESCISSIRSKTDYSNYSILIIDNGSKDQATLDYLNTQKKLGCQVIKDPRPFNFASLMNEHTSSIDTDLVCFMNNDVEVIDATWLTDMTRLIVQPDVAIVGAKLLYDDDTVQHSGVVLGIGGVAGHSHKYLHGEYPGYADRNICVQELSAVTAACMLVDRKVFSQVGGMDASQLKIAFNDVDFCLKVRKMGYKVLWTPFARLYHHESKSRGQEDTEAKVIRFHGEVEVMKARWGEMLDHDPAYNPNLSLEHEDFSLSQHPRLPSFKETMDQLKQVANKID